jgi:putative ABC transport system permease protein
MDTLLDDLRYTIRTLIKAPAFSLAAIAALTLGIGANTGIFSVVNAVLLKPVDAPDPERLVFLMNTFAEGSGPGASPAKFVHWRAQTSVLENVSAFRSNVVNYTSGGIPEQLRAGQVSADFFRLFGAPVVRGRTFSEAEDRPNGERVTVLSHGLWTRRFGSDPGIVGRSITLGGEPYAVIGILGPGFDVESFGLNPELWIPFQIDPNTTDQGHYFSVAGRLKPGVTLEQAHARVQLSAQDYRARFPNAIGPKEGFGVERMHAVLVRNVRTALLILSGAVGFVLLIACANVANLLLVRATGRRRELAVRAALGAGRGRIMRQLLTESVVLSLAGGALGLVLGIAGIRALLSIDTAGLPRIGEHGLGVGVDWRVAAFALVVSVATGILFGLIPAVQGSGGDLSSTLKESAGRSGTGRQNKARAILVVSEVALALILLVGSALLIRTSLALRAVNPGFDAAHVLTMRMSLQNPRFFEAAAVERLVRDGVERLRAVPGVEVASAACCVPLEGGYGLGFVIQGRPLTDRPFHGGGSWLTVSPGYFEVFRIAMKRGRSFEERDDRLAPPVVIINEAFARQYFKNGDPLTERLVIGHSGDVGMREFMTEPPRQIVGVASDIRDSELNEEPRPTMYIPQAQMPDAANQLNVRITPMAWVVRTRTAPYAVSAAVQEQLRQASGLPVSDVRSMEDVVSRSISRQRFNMLLMTMFGASALLLAAIGIYGLMAYSVEQRTQEIGIRVALGAQARDVRRMIILQGMRLAVVGVIIGLGSAFGLARVIANLLYGVTAQDPLVFTSVPLVLTAVAFVGVWLPARRAVAVDPVVALRAE